MSISDDRADKAVEFIRDNAERHGQIRTACILAEYKVKRARALAFLQSAGTVAEREARSWLNADVVAATEEHANMEGDEVALRDFIKAADMTFEKWRTEQANQRRGNV